MPGDAAGRSGESCGTISLYAATPSVGRGAASPAGQCTESGETLPPCKAFPALSGGAKFGRRLSRPAAFGGIQTASKHIYS